MGTETSYLMGKDPFLVGKTPLLVGKIHLLAKSSYLIDKNLFLVGKSHILVDKILFYGGHKLPFDGQKTFLWWAKTSSNPMGKFFQENLTSFLFLRRHDFVI